MASAAAGSGSSSPLLAPCGAMAPISVPCMPTPTSPCHARPRDHLRSCHVRPRRRHLRLRHARPDALRATRGCNQASIVGLPRRAIHGPITASGRPPTVVRVPVHAPSSVNPPPPPTVLPTRVKPIPPVVNKHSMTTHSKLCFRQPFIGLHSAQLSPIPKTFHSALADPH